ncbi:MAG: hypothetical protein IJ615_01440 [Bacteroidaceae bacterium]|nr:hypothetical protein [Bacteroidaceae bacterium]
MAVVVLLAATSCSNESIDVSNEQAVGQALAPVTVSVSGFSVSQEEFPDGTTRAAEDVADYSGVKALTLAFYSGSTETYKETQTRGALEEGETFGEFSLSLPLGSYTMVVIGHGLNDGEPAVTLTSPTEATFGEHPARETFVTTQTVNIASMDAVDISATLNRIIAKLQVVSTDGRTANAAKVRVTMSAGGKAFNPTTGLAISNTGIINTLGISAAAGTTSSSNSYLFLVTDEQTMDVTIETLDADGAVLFSKTVNNVPFKRNRVTKLTGAMYTNNSVSGAFQVETGWLSDYNGTF